MNTIELYSSLKFSFQPPNWNENQPFPVLAIAEIFKFADILGKAL